MPLRVTAEVTDSRARMVRIKGWIAPVDQLEAIVCEADGTFLPLPDDVRDEAIAEWPGLAGFFGGEVTPQ